MVYTLSNTLEVNLIKLTKKLPNVASTGIDLKASEIDLDDSSEFLSRLCAESEKLSQKIYNRSSSYIFMGSLIALIGIIYFSFQSVQILENSMGMEMLISFIPRIGALVFIELIAFFFLKQYRVTIDDFKYYESIKRQREANLFIFKIHIEDEDLVKKENIESLLKSLELFQNPSLLKANETTESIENRKYSNQELDILNNIISQLGKSNNN